METGKVQKRWKMVVTGEEEGKRTTRETDRPRGEGMQDIAAPRDTRGRNLHDGAGDVLQSCSPATTKSLGSHVWIAYSPWLVSRKVSIYSDYRLPPPLPPCTSRTERASTPVFSLVLSPTLPEIRRTKISFSTGAEDQDGKLRDASCVADFFHYDSWLQSATLTLSLLTHEKRGCIVNLPTGWMGSKFRECNRHLPYCFVWSMFFI